MDITTRSGRRNSSPPCNLHSFLRTPGSKSTANSSSFQAEAQRNAVLGPGAPGPLPLTSRHPLTTPCTTNGLLTLTTASPLPSKTLTSAPSPFQAIPSKASSPRLTNLVLHPSLPPPHPHNPLAPPPPSTHQGTSPAHPPCPCPHRPSRCSKVRS